MIKFHPGIRPSDPRKARLYFRMFAKAGATPPATVDYSAFTPVGMMGNGPDPANPPTIPDGCGDCTEAMNGHHIEQQTFYGQKAEYVVSTQQVLGAYSQATGFDPSDPATDQGDTMQNALSFYRTNGIGGHKLAAFAQVDATNITEVKLAVAEFGSVFLAMAFPASAMTQFNDNQPFDVVADDGGIEGGHAVLVTGYTDAYLVTSCWGRPQKMTWAFYNKYVAARGMGEVWCGITADWVDAASGMDPEGVDKYAFGAQFAALTGQPNPFPAPDPTPVPDPTPPPTPAPGPDKAEIAMAGAAHRFLARHWFRPKYLVTALENWLTDKDL